MATTTLDLGMAFNKLCDDLEVDNSTRVYCLQRFRAENVKFFTVTLPCLSKSVLQSLEAGVFIRPTNFAWKGSSLRYFRSLLSKIFTRSGKVSQDSESVAYGVYAVRQLCDYMYKLAFSFSDAETAAAEEKFANTDKSLELIDIDTEFINQCRKNFETYYLPKLPRDVDSFLKKGQRRDGPGSFAKHSSCTSVYPYYVEKQVFQTQYPTNMSAHSGFYKPYPSYKEGILQVCSEDKTSEVLFVAKDSRGPRVISREPHRNLQAQLAFLDVVTPALERATKGRINFESQDVNRGLVLQASIDKLNSTLDLKDGSDRVSYALCKRIFGQWTGLINLFNLCRSTSARLPSGRIIRLNKVAGMGSGFTFPLMALLIHLSIATRITQRSSLRFEEAMKLVYVYGDDVIVPTCYFSEAKEALVSVGLEINVGKSFLHSKFRESCGLDAYDGIEVVPVRLKLTSAELGLPSKQIHLNDACALQLERHCRELVKSGLWNLSNYYYEILEQYLNVNLPNITGDTNVLGRFVFNSKLITNWDKKVSVFIPVTPDKNVPEVCPYGYLKSRLVPKTPDPLRHMRTEKLSAFGNVSIPHAIVLRKRSTFGRNLKGL